MARTYGRLGYEKGAFWLEVEPHVAGRLKAVITRLKTNADRRLTLADSPATCADLVWFTQRYPLQVEPEAKRRLSLGQRHYRKTIADVQKVINGKLKVRPIKLGLTPRHYQAIGIELMRRRRAVLLTDEMGLGKTLQALGVVADPVTQPAVVVVKPDLANQWLRQVELVLPGTSTHRINGRKPYQLPPAQVYVVSYNILEAWAPTLGTFANTVIFDEMQQLRHGGTGKHTGAKRLCQDIADRRGWRLGLTGTPVYNYGGEIFTILDLLEPGALGTFAEFSREWCGGYTRNGQLVVKEPANLGRYLYEQGLMVGRTRQQVQVELPPRTRMVESVDIEAVDRFLKADTLAIAQQVLRGATFMERGQAARDLDWRLRQATGVAKARHVAEYAKLFLERGERLVIFGWHREFWTILQELLREYGMVLYTGTESPTQKGQAVDRFIRGEVKVLGISLRSGEGLDGLQQVCQTVIHGELDWSPMVHEQGFYRIFRPGQEKACLELFIVADSGSDPVVATVNGLKRSQADGIVRPDEPGAVLSTEGLGRVKQLAADFLRQRGVKVDEKEVYDEVEPATVSQAETAGSVVTAGTGSDRTGTG